MASLFSHLAIGATTTKAATTIAEIRSSVKLLLLVMFASAMPDLDIMAFDFGIPYTHWLGHRGLTHSVAFAAGWSVLMLVFFFRHEIRSLGHSVAYFLLFFITTASHGLVDAMTNGGRGIGFFIPFSDERYFLPFRPIQVSPLGVENFFSEWGRRVIISEMIWVILPCVVLWLAFHWIGKPNGSK